MDAPASLGDAGASPDPVPAEAWERHQQSITYSGAFLSTFKTNPYELFKLLEDCHRGGLQLPDFQRSWVWDEDRIKSLITLISRAVPVGALMTLDTGGGVNFKPRPVEGAPADAKEFPPHSLLLDGQQRMTSLYQVTLRGKVVETITPKNEEVKRWFYIDIGKALDPYVDREEAVVGMPEDCRLHDGPAKETPCAHLTGYRPACLCR